jgi:hypothetical protein
MVNAYSPAPEATFMRLRSRLTYANVMSSIAVLLALGGTSYAAATITGKNVKNSSLTGVDVKNSSLTSSDVKDKSLLSKDFKAGQLPAGPAGPQGPKGTDGTNGMNGEPGTSIFKSTIPSGTTVRGAWGIGGGGGGSGISETGVSLPVPSSTPLTSVKMAPDALAFMPDSSCSGTDDEPTAPAGKACVYITNTESTSAVGASPLEGNPSGSDRFGFLVYANSMPADTVEAYGTWAYTAP